MDCKDEFCEVAWVDGATFETSIDNYNNYNVIPHPEGDRVMLMEAPEDLTYKVTDVQDKSDREDEVCAKLVYGY